MSTSHGRSKISAANEPGAATLSDPVHRRQPPESPLPGILHPVLNSNLPPAGPEHLPHLLAKNSSAAYHRFLLSFVRAALSEFRTGIHPSVRQVHNAPAAIFRRSRVRLLQL